MDFLVEPQGIISTDFDCGCYHCSGANNNVICQPQSQPCITQCNDKCYWNCPTYECGIDGPVYGESVFNA